MKKLLLITTIIIFTLGSSLAIAQEQEAKTIEVLRLELNVLEAQAQAKVNELNRYLIQVEFLRLKIPVVDGEINELKAQIRKKVSEITEAERPVVEKPAVPVPKKEE